MTRKIATYMPSANSDPCARLIVSITPTISMKPSAIRANSSPSEMPLRGAAAADEPSSAPLAATARRGRLARPRRSLLVARRRRHRLELAGLGRALVLDVLRRHLGEDAVDVVLLGRACRCSSPCRSSAAAGASPGSCRRRSAACGRGAETFRFSSSWITARLLVVPARSTALQQLARRHVAVVVDVARRA